MQYQTWSDLPQWVRMNHQTHRRVLSENSDEAVKVTPNNSKPDSPSRSTVISSKSRVYDHLHRPMIDLDLDAALVPSSTPGHNHLYINRPIDEKQYERLLFVMRDCGLVQPGVYNSFKLNQETSLRIPGVSKGGPLELEVRQEFEGDAEVNELKKKIKELQDQVENIQSIKKINPFL